MGREILSISAGQCGNQMGEAFWGLMSKEHALSADGNYRGSQDYELEKISGLCFVFHF
jgi:tubulin beta